MTEPREPDDTELRRLFDRTASEASGPTLTKLGARAADIPQRASHRSWFAPRWAWATAFAGVALGGLLAVRSLAPRAAPQAPPELGSSSPMARLAVATSSARELVAGGAPRVTGTASEETSDNPELLGDADEGAHFDVSGPQSDRDLDAWLAATKELSGGT